MKSHKAGEELKKILEQQQQQITCVAPNLQKMDLDMCYTHNVGSNFNEPGMRRHFPKSLRKCIGHLGMLHCY